MVITIVAHLTNASNQQSARLTTPLGPSTSESSVELL